MFLGAALGLILVFMAGEVVVGLLVSLLALSTDAGHMLTDAATIAVALITARLATRPVRGNLTYGLRHPNPETLDYPAWEFFFRLG